MDLECNDPMRMRLHLGGHLSYFDALQRADLEIDLACKERLTDILATLRIPVGEVFITSINGEAVPRYGWRLMKLRILGQK